MTVDDVQKGLLAITAWRAAGHISFPACVAVLFCLRNRLEANGDNDWMRAIGESVDARDPEFLKILEVVDSIYDGTRADSLSNNATHWTPAEGRERVATIGGFELYK
jgi:hypothetical protein